MDDDEQVKRIFRDFNVDSSTKLKMKHLPYIRVAMIGISRKWYDIGVYLKVELNKLDGIKDRCKKDNDKCLTAMLAAWLSDSKPEAPPTWRTVVAVMAYRVAGDHPSEAQKVAETYLDGASHGSFPEFASVDSTPLNIGHLGDVVEAIYDVATKWQEIGLLLGISHMKLQILEQEEDQLNAKVRGMVEHWLKGTYSVETFGKPSWKALVEAIAARAGGDYRRLALEIADKHLGAGSSSSTGQNGTAQVAKVGATSTSGENGTAHTVKVGGEYERVSRKCEDIIRFLAKSVNPEGLAGRLLVEKLIGEDVRDQAFLASLTNPEKIRRMMYAVIARIELSSVNYEKFIVVLKQDGSLGDLIKFIET